MLDKHLTAQGWKVLAKKHEASDGALEKALTKYGQLKDDKLNERLEALEDIKKLATAAKTVHKTKREVASYLDNVLEEVDKVQRALVQEKKTAAKTDEEGNDPGEDDLVASLNRVRGGAELQFCACVGNPFAVAVARHIGGMQKRALKAINSGTVFVEGSCIFEANAHTFVVPRLQGGLAGKLKKALALQTNKSYKVRVRAWRMVWLRTTPRTPTRLPRSTFLLCRPALMQKTRHATPLARSPHGF